MPSMAFVPSMPGRVSRGPPMLPSPPMSSMPWPHALHQGCSPPGGRRLHRRPRAPGGAGRGRGPQRTPLPPLLLGQWWVLAGSAGGWEGRRSRRRRSARGSGACMAGRCGASFFCMAQGDGRTGAGGWEVRGVRGGHGGRMGAWAMTAERMGAHGLFHGVLGAGPSHRAPSNWLQLGVRARCCCIGDPPQRVREGSGPCQVHEPNLDSFRQRDLAQRQRRPRADHRTGGAMQRPSTRRGSN
jgi:hypothetical protein